MRAVMFAHRLRLNKAIESTREKSKKNFKLFSLYAILIDFQNDNIHFESIDDICDYFTVMKVSWTRLFLSSTLSSLDPFCLCVQVYVLDGYLHEISIAKNSPILNQYLSMAFFSNLSSFQQ